MITNIQKEIENQYSNEQIKVWKKVKSPKDIDLEMEDRIIFCAFKNDRLIGTIGLKGNEVVGLYVSHSKRNTGIGSKVLEHLERYAIANKFEELYLTATISAFQFYIAKGYQDLNPVVVRIQGIDFKKTKMMKKLTCIK